MVKHDATQDTIDDWLALHGLTNAECHKMLGFAARYDPAYTAKEKSNAKASSLQVKDWDGERAWQAAATALAAWQICSPEMLSAVATATKRVFDLDPKTYPQAFTLHSEVAGEIIVGCPFLGRAADINSVAHEFGHALQLNASGDVQMVPVLRETCAFLAEIALSKHLTKQHPDLGIALLWQQKIEASQFLGPYADTLGIALSDPKTPYRYQWNYPIAKGLALEISTHRNRKYSPEFLSALFAGQLGLADILRLLQDD